MSKVYKIEQDGFKYQELDLRINDYIKNFPDSFSYQELQSFSAHNIALSKYWELLRTGFSPIEDEENLIPDISPWVDATLLLSPKAFRLLGDSLKPYGEFLPILIEMGEAWEEYKIFNCLTMAEVIESESDDYNITFDSESISNKLIFKTAFQHCMNLYCQDNFRLVVEDFNLKGIIFNEKLGVFANYSE